MHLQDLVIEGKTATVINHFDCMQDLFDAECSDGPYKQMNANYSHGVETREFKSEHISKTAWYGVPGLQKAIDCLRDGWPAGKKRGDMHVERLQFPPVRVPTVRRYRKMKEFGDEVDMQRVYSGDLDRAWESRERSAGSMTQSPSVVIMCNTGMRSNQKADDLFWTGAVVCNMARWLVESGRSVRVISHAFATDDLNDRYKNVSYYTSVVVKDFTSPLDEEMLFAHTALGAMHRVAIFKSRCLLGSIRYPDAMGLTAHRIDFESPFVSTGNATEVRINRITSESEARNFIDQQVKLFGG